MEPKTVDGFAARRGVRRVVMPVRQHSRRTFTAPAVLQPRRRRWQPLIFPVLLLLCICGSFLVQSLPIGMAIIAIYGVVVWAKRLSSRLSFMLAFLSLATVVALLAIRQNVDLAGNFATYTFLLLVVGIVSSILESHVNIKHKRSRIYR